MKMASDFRKDPEDAAVNSGNFMEAIVNPPIQIDSDCHDKRLIGDKRSMRRRNGIDYGVFDYSSEEELNDVKSMKSFQSKRSHQTNAVRGSKVCYEHEGTAKWSPKESCRPTIDEAPSFYPSEEEFRDTLGYIASIRPIAEKYGICRIIPPPSWKPPCPLKEKNIWENSKFSTRVQQVDKLQNREPMRKKLRNRCQRKRKRRKRSRFGMTRRRNNYASAEINDCPSDTDEKFGFQSGSDFTLQSFKTYAENFKERYFGGLDFKESEACFKGKTEKRWRPSVDEIEGEYWRIVENPADEVEVLYGADLETGIFGSGFPKANLTTPDDLDPHIYSGWNLNNFPRLPGSVLSFESGDISGVLVPWLYIGMCFSSFCWHVEDHHLYSLNYMHWGDPKVWYGVPGTEALKLEEAMRKHLPELFEEQPDLLHELVTQLSPSVLKSDGVPVYRAIQKAGEFVLTFPRAYHAGFNCGFNCAEAVNVAPMDWLPHGQCAVELYREQRRKTSISHDKLLMGAAREAVKALWEISLLGLSNPSNLKWKSICGKDGVLTKAITAKVAVEKENRELHCDSTKTREMDTVTDPSKERECFFCFYDLHLSAAGCECSLNRYACVTHAELLCSCKSRQHLLFIRYSIDQLNTLVQALEGCLNAVRQWGTFDIGFVSPSIAGVTEASNGLVDISIASERHISDAIVHQSEINSTECIQILDEDFDSDKLSMSRNVDLEASEMLKKFETSCITRVKTELESGNLSKSAYCITPDFVSLQKTDYMCHKASSKKYETFSADIVMEEDRRWLLDLNKESLTKYGSGEMMKIANERGCSSTAAKQERPLLMAIDSWQEDKSEMEHEFMARSDTSLRSSPDVGSSFSHGNSFEFSPSRPPQNSCRKIASTSKGVQSRAMLFGFELLQHQPLQPSSKSSVNSNGLNSFIPERQKCLSNSKYIVEPLHLGTLMLGKQWCNASAIFPKGFQSRVRYYSILDPTVTCSYISEVLDGGLIGPLFKVTLEDSPEDTFLHSSPVHCWDLVRERLNQEIIKQCSLRNKDLPPLQPPGSINGLEMFGFLSPSIRQDIESNDPFYEYWASKLTSSIIEAEINSTMKPIKKPSIGYASTNHNSLTNASSENRGTLFGAGTVKLEQTDFTSDTEAQQQALRPLLNRLKQDELMALHNVFRSGSESESWRAAYRALMYEIEKNVD